MRDREGRKLDKYDRHDAFMVDNAADHPRDSVGDKIITLMRADIALAKQYAAGQISGVDERALHVGNKQDDLDDLEAIMRLLDLAGDALTDDFPGIENLFGVPRNRSEASMLAAARSQYDLSEQYEAAMIGQDMPETFRADMLALINSIESKDQSADIAAEQSTGATGGFQAALSRLGKNAKKLDAHLRIKYRNDPVKLSAWNRANHLERDPKPKKDGDTD